MENKITRWENYGKGYKEVAIFNFNDSETKELYEAFINKGFKRVRGSGLIGIELELKTDLNIVKITFEKVEK